MQLPSTIPADAVLRAQASAYTLVFAIQVPFLLAIFGTARTLQRPGMRGFTLVYALLSLSWIFSALSVTTRLGDGAELLHDVTLAVSIGALVSMWAANRIAAAAMAGASQPPASLWGIGLALAALGSAIAIVGQKLPVSGSLGSMLRSGAPRPVILFLFLLCLADVWRLSATASRNADALRLVSLSFAVLVLRQTYGIIATVFSALGHPLDPDVLVFVQASTTALNGVALLAALIFAERNEMALQAERTRATELRLERTQRLESLGRMAGGIAHDFANVLMVIQGEVACARESRDLATIDSHLGDAENAVDRATGLTRQLALFARQRPPEVTVFAVTDRLATIEPVLRRLAGPTVAFDIDMSALADATIAMDASQFDQIFLNLVINARDAMPNGGALQLHARALTVHRANTDVLWHRFESSPDDRVASIEVRDTGTGISGDVIERIFDPFYSTKGDRGTGLGLATVLSVVRTANGAVDVRSTVGEGSTFVVQLPLAAEPAQVAPTSHRVTSGQSERVAMRSL